MTGAALAEVVRSSRRRPTTSTGSGSVSGNG